MKRLLVLLLLVATAAFAIERQPNDAYRHRRQALARAAEGRVVLVFAKSEGDLTEDLTGFRQDENFYYLTGVNVPGAAVLIVPALDAQAVALLHAQLPAGRPATLKERPYSELLLLPTRNRAAERWTGAKIGPDDPEAKTLGFDRVASMDALRTELANALSPLGDLLFVNEGTAAKVALDWMKRNNVNAYVRDAQPLITPLRMVKDAGEIELLRKAVDASVAAHVAAIKAMKPGTGERQIKALMQYEFERRGCERPAYAPIVGARSHSTELHYDSASGPINNGDVVVMDVGGEYSGYAADITRTVPANGRFTARQREIYDIVLGAQEAAIKAFKAGQSRLARNAQDSLDSVARDYINTHGKDLHGQPLGQYFIHGLGHHLGLDVHDPGEYDKPIDRGMVFTLEPGIYIPDENIGIRIEDDFWVDPSGKLVNLSEKLPRRAEDLEKVMNVKP
ncbi:MAG: aminopeptidase P N-terminal domain-containing protein [Terriglobales bacterium]